MGRSVKAPVGRRERKAQETRLRILDAAEALFVRDGYAATSIASVAEAADVAVQTVYAVFGNKRTLLTQLVEVRVVGDDDATPLTQRDEWQALEAEPDPHRQLELLASFSIRMGRRLGALYAVMTAAAGADPEIGQLLNIRQQSRYKDQRRLVQLLARRGALRPDLSETHATDIMWTIANPNTYRTLVTDRRWSEEEYRSWLGQLLACALLR